MQFAGRDAGRDAQHRQNVEDAAAHHIANRDVPLAAQGRHHRRRHFGQRGAGGDDGQADDQFANAEIFGKGHGRVHQPIRAQDQQGETGQDQQSLHAPVRIPALRPAFERLVIFGPDGGRLAPALANDDDRIADDQAASSRPSQRLMPPSAAIAQSSSDTPIITGTSWRMSC